jgi:D-alanyl-D-alanine carboxypeptidase
MDASTGVVLYSNAGDYIKYPASITKIMTALVVLEQVQDLNERILFSHRAIWGIDRLSSHIAMDVGETLTVYEALYAFMLRSGNEVANALAEHVSGDMPAFIEKMNNRAYELGAYDTSFINACGMPGEDQHTTSYDMALIMLAALQHPAFVRIISTPYTYLPPVASEPDYRLITNINRMINEEMPEYNEWMIGGKTGFTNAAQNTFVTYSQRGGRSLIISTLHVPLRATLFSDMNDLIEFAFSSFPEL